MSYEYMPGNIDYFDELKYLIYCAIGEDGLYPDFVIRPHYAAIQDNSNPFWAGAVCTDGGLNLYALGVFSHSKQDKKALVKGLIRDRMREGVTTYYSKAFPATKFWIKRHWYLAPFYRLRRWWLKIK